MLVWVLISMLLKGEWIVLNLGHLTGGTTSRIEPLRLWIRLLTILPSQTRANQADQCQHCCTAVMIFNLLHRWLSEGKYFSTPKFSSSGSRTHDLWTTLKRNLSHWARASPDFLIFFFFVKKAKKYFAKISPISESFLRTRSWQRDSIIYQMTSPLITSQHKSGVFSP